ncbi:MAG: hypothetical protein H6807_08810 [Planctomycetes bacterium]|nr:hypothetical protein [Planctomycetota bacterium]
MGGTATLMRTAEKINAEYNLEKWASVRELIDAAIARHGDDLSRCFWEVVRQVRGKPGLERANTVYGGEIHELPKAAVWAGYHGTIAEILQNEIRPDTRVIAELGSGWGLYLFLLWLRGAPADASYYALEFTENGRLCTEAMATVEPRMAIRALPFDFYEPDYREIESDGHALFFSCTAIEQIPQLPSRAIEGLLDRAPRVTGIHLEPVGWQFRDEVGEPGRHGTTRAYAEEQDYNRNLWQTLQALEKRGLIAIETAIPDEIGVKTTNVLSVIKWRKI